MDFVFVPIYSILRICDAIRNIKERICGGLAADIGGGFPCCRASIRRLFKRIFILFYFFNFRFRSDDGRYMERAIALRLPGMCVMCTVQHASSVVSRKTSLFLPCVMRAAYALPAHPALVYNSHRSIFSSRRELYILCAVRLHESTHTHTHKPKSKYHMFTCLDCIHADICWWVGGGSTRMYVYTGWVRVISG